MTAGRLGATASAATALLGILYAATLGIGLGQVGFGTQPIGEPIFSLLEILILLLMPVMVALMAAVYATAAAEERFYGLLALVFTAMMATVTGSLHFVILTVSHLPDFAGAPWSGVFAFRWPSIAYALDIFAWDVLFALSVLCAARTFRGATRRLLMASGILALAGLAAVPIGDMNWRMIGVAGYAGLFPLAALLMMRDFARAEANRA